MVYPKVTEIRPPRPVPPQPFLEASELVFRRPVSAAASLSDRLWFAWDEAQLEADRAYEAWSLDGRTERYAVYRASQDRADAAQDALALCLADAEQAP
jgi:hypothetical protein